MKTQVAGQEESVDWAEVMAFLDCRFTFVPGYFVQYLDWLCGLGPADLQVHFFKSSSALGGSGRDKKSAR
jgi:hypothetical protein